MLSKIQSCSAEIAEKFDLNLCPLDYLILLGIQNSTTSPIAMEPK